jgi:hypothetical protein
MKGGNGLYLEIRPNDSRFWRYRYRIAGKKNFYAVGEYPALSFMPDRLLSLGDEDKLPALSSPAIAQIQMPAAGFNAGKARLKRGNGTMFRIEKRVGDF